jgi:glycosyltransferase involved in cell wall biosynthesis
VLSSSIFIILPAYNEEPMIRAVLQSLIQLNYSIVVVDDGSGDNTWSVIEDLPVQALRHAINLGPGAALSTGMKFALQQGAEIMVLFDADGQHRMEDVDVLLEPLLAKEADVVFGSRFLRAADKELVPPLRRLFLKGAVMVNALMTGAWLNDAHNGFIALTREAALKVRLREKGFAYHSELLNQVRKLGLRYVERPTTITYSEYSRAKGQSMWNAVNIVLDLMLGRVFR